MPQTSLSGSSEERGPARVLSDRKASDGVLIGGADAIGTGSLGDGRVTDGVVAGEPGAYDTVTGGKLTDDEEGSRCGLPAGLSPEATSGVVRAEEPSVGTAALPSLSRIDMKLWTTSVGRLAGRGRAVEIAGT